MRQAESERPSSLVQLADLKGDLHSHTTYSDGEQSVEQMAAQAIRAGHEYLAITDHAMSLHVASHTAQSLLSQAEEIEQLNARFEGSFTLLRGVELDIGADGELADLNGLVHHVDVVIASLHTHFDMDRDSMTRRVIRALQHPFVKIFGHPTARRIGTRPPADFDLDAVFAVAAENRVALEINSTPTRLDLKEEHIRLAKTYGCTFSIDTDSHSASRLERIRLGVELAQNGGLTSEDVINCLPVGQLRNLLAKA